MISVSEERNKPPTSSGLASLAPVYFFEISHPGTAFSGQLSGRSRGTSRVFDGIRTDDAVVVLGVVDVSVYGFCFSVTIASCSASTPTYSCSSKGLGPQKGAATPTVDATEVRQNREARVASDGRHREMGQHR